MSEITKVESCTLRSCLPKCKSSPASQAKGKNRFFYEGDGSEQRTEQHPVVPTSTGYLVSGRMRFQVCEYGDAAKEDRPRNNVMDRTDELRIGFERVWRNPIKVVLKLRSFSNCAWRKPFKVDESRRGREKGET